MKCHFNLFLVMTKDPEVKLCQCRLQKHGQQHVIYHFSVSHVTTEEDYKTLVCQIFILTFKQHSYIPCLVYLELFKMNSKVFIDFLMGGCNIYVPLASDHFSIFSMM